MGERVARTAVAAALAAGAFLRLFQYAANRSLWLDEAVLAPAVLSRGWAGLLRPLPAGQTAPLGFLALQRAAVAAFGTGELALRLVPLLAGLAALFAFPAVARRYVSRGGAAVATLLFAFAPFLVYYSSEAKQYSLDVLVALAVLAACAPPPSGRPRRRALPVLLATGVLGVWLSQPAVFVLAGCGLTLLAGAVRAGERRRAAALAAVGAAWLASFAAAYLASRRSVADAEYLHAFWRSGFLPLDRHAWTWTPRMLARVFREPLGVYGEDTSLLTHLQTAAGIAAFALGAASLARRAPPRLAMLGLPAALALVASAAALYPFGGEYPTAGRVLLFAVPGLVLVIGEGVAAMGRRASPAPRAAAAALALLCVAPSLQYAAAGVPHVRAEIKPLLGYARDHRRPGDVLYVYYRAWPSFTYYARRYGWTGASVVRGACERLTPAAYLTDLGRLRGGGRRVWLLFVDGTSEGNFDERKLMYDYLQHVGLKLDGQVSHGAWLYLYDLRPEAAWPRPFRATIPRYAYDAALDCRGPWGPR